MASLTRQASTPGIIEVIHGVAVMASQAFRSVQAPQGDRSGRLIRLVNVILFEVSAPGGLNPMPY